MGAPDANGWLTIDSAPRDGTWFLGWEPRRSIEDTIRVWNWDAGAGEDGCGMWIDAADSVYDEQPTHWMPLPSPPVTP